jgi:hypothetical protein
MSIETYMNCPFCHHEEQVSEEDPDASFSDMLGHIRWRHHDEDQSPAVLWPKIQITSSE